MFRNLFVGIPAEVTTLEEIERMTAQEAAEAALLMSGTVHAPLWVRIKAAAGLIVSLVLLVILLWKSPFGVLYSIIASLMLILFVFGFARRTLTSIWNAVRYDGYTGEITCRRAFREDWVFYASQIETIERRSDQYGENEVRWQYSVKRSTPVVTFAHFEDSVQLHVDGQILSVMLRRTSMGRASSHSYEGGDVGIEEFDRYLRLLERSRRPDPDPDAVGSGYQRGYFPAVEPLSGDMPVI
ncbi:MAG: hypothetical protein K5695_05985 [Oscillospiraceae bacterium]|nr:hypothetical protein [Oscillospiraceae bacterium]